MKIEKVCEKIVRNNSYGQLRYLYNNESACIKEIKKYYIFNKEMKALENCDIVRYYIGETLNDYLDYRIKNNMGC